jgi:hypothetical protein
MWNARLIQGLLKRLCQVFAAFTTSSAQRLRVLAACFRCFLTNIRGRPRHNTSPAQCDTVANTSSARCPQVTSLLPLHDRRAESSTPPGVMLSSTPTSSCIMPTPSVPPQAISPCTSFAPITANEVLRYRDRPLVYVLYHNIG